MLVRSKTDGAARYMFSRLQRGKYKVRVSTSGTSYEGQTAEVDIAGLSRGGASDAGSDSIQQNIYLRIKMSPASDAKISGVVFAQDIPPQAKKLYEKAVSDLKDKKTDDAYPASAQPLRFFQTITWPF